MQLLKTKLLTAVHDAAAKYLPGSIQWAVRLLSEVLETYLDKQIAKVEQLYASVDSPETLRVFLEKLFAGVLEALNTRPFTKHVVGVLTGYIVEYGTQAIWGLLQSSSDLIGFGAQSQLEPSDAPTPAHCEAIAGVQMSLVSCHSIPLCCHADADDGTEEEPTTLEPTKPE